MSRLFKRFQKKSGLPPGTLIHIGEKKADKISLSLVDYDEKNVEETFPETIEQTFRLKETPTVTWIDITGLHDMKLIEKIGAHFGIHPLTLEDIVNTEQRPKVEDYGHYLYIVCKMLHYNEEESEVISEQISIILGERFLISFQEVEGDVFSAVRERIEKGQGRIRRSGVDYLAYALLDAIVDHYFAVLGVFGEKIEQVEDLLLDSPEPAVSHLLHDMKREMIYLRKLIWPLREVLGQLIKRESQLMQDSTVVFLRDVYDHAIQVSDTIESYRDMLSGMLDVYLSLMSHKMNEVMKVLTIIATIFIPVTFIAGIYGMNFQYMPELQWRYGYHACLLLMFIVVVILLAYFKKKDWL